jgi:DNA-binding GntR family transcriptional regulator
MEELSKRLDAYSKIKNLILNHELSPGQKLICRDLEDKLKMTKTPIISGLSMLEQDGFVISKKNCGFYVTQIDIGKAETIFKVRESLEIVVLQYALEEHTKGEIALLRGKLNAYQKYVSPIYDNTRRDLDTAFHLQIAEMTKNSFLFSIMKQFYENIYFSINVIYLTPLIDTFRKQHNMIFEALRKRDTTAAHAILKEHNRIAGECLASMR